MKNKVILYASILLFVLFTSCNETKKSKLDFNSEFPLAVPIENSLYAQWAKKQVLDSILIDDMENDVPWKVRGIAEIKYTEERAIDGKRSLRYQTSLRDTAHMKHPDNRSEWDSFIGGQGGDAGFSLTFEEPQDWSEYNRISIWLYIHPSSNQNYHLCFEINNEGTIYNTITPPRATFIHDLEAGSWQQIFWEIPHMPRNKVTRFSISQILIGYNYPDGDDPVTCDFDRLQLHRVDTDKYEGWSTPEGKFAFSHIGYRPNDPKIALFSDADDKTFQLIDQNNKIVFQGTVDVLKNKNGDFYQLDFSDFRNEGIYRLRCGTSVSNSFPINQDIWLDPLHSALNFYFCQRCGFDVPGIHSVCHEDWQGFHGDVKKIINGGWHDAGDLSQGHFRTAMGVFALMSNLEEVQKDKRLELLADKLRDEVVWGLEWLLKTRFGNGYHMSWSTNRIYTDNIIGTIDDVVSPAQNLTWENFFGAAVETKASQLFKDSHPELAEETRIAAIEDWKAAVASREIWERASYQEASWGAISSVFLYKLTKDAIYKEYAVKFGNLLLQCQEQSFPGGIPVTGFFYNSTGSRRIIQNDHASFNEAIMIAFRALCLEFPYDENWINWYSSAVIYSEFFIKQGSSISAPYNLVPNAVYRKSDIMAITDDVRRELSLKQYNDGTALNDEYVIRTFPIWRDALFHGATNTQLSATWALAEASLLRNDTEGIHLTGKQLQWVMGKNPFDQSLMYGVGYNFAPQFAYCTHNVVGSLPVGMDCLSGDEPNWSSTNNATFKEMWIEPVSRFIGSVAAYRSHSEKLSTGNINLEVKKLQLAGNTQKAALTIGGVGDHNIDIKTFNSKTNITNKAVKLSKGKPEEIELDITILDKNKPYVVVITIDGKPELRKEIVGTIMH